MKRAAPCVLALAATWVTMSAACAEASEGHAQTGDVAGRPMTVFVPSRLPADHPALVVVVHGGMESAERIRSRGTEHVLALDAVAAQSGFVVAYANGTPAMFVLARDRLAWNAGGGCCGRPAFLDVDDVGYLAAAIDVLATRHAIDRARIFGIGHSNGAMLVLRVLCERGIFAAAVAISGPLNLAADSDCSAARGRRVLAIHGADDRNVPIGGGRGTRGLSTATVNAEESSRRLLAAAGAHHVLDVVPDAAHRLDELDAAMVRRDGRGIAATMTAFFGLDRKESGAGR